MSLVHVAGLDVEMMGRYLRQRCSWCGALLIDEDYTRLAMPGEWRKPGTFPVGRLVRVTEGNPRAMTVLDDERLPDDACFVESEMDVTTPGRGEGRG